ncbi:MAG TPA: T9SS type A sorting domain-containing protein [Puia sp.]|nr:T9SS type A sorting domain-containing protein [Puia sp.]
MEKISLKATSHILKTLALSAALVVVLNESNAQMCTNPGTTIYSLSNAGGIYPITVSNANVGSIVNATAMNSTSAANGVGFNTINGLFYYFQNANSGGSQQFVSYNPITNTYTTLASAPITGTVNKGCMSFNGVGYYCIDNKGNLCYYDIPSNTWTLICSVFTDQYGNNVTSVFTSQGSGDVAIDGLGNLWIVTSNSSNWGLYKLPTPLPTTSIASITVQQLITPTTSTLSGANFVGIAFDPSGNIFMATNYNLYKLSTSLSLSLLGAFNVSGICGDLTSCNFPFTILAVSFENITATAQNDQSVSISWTVSEQKNNKGYYIEHSTNGSDWNELSFVAINATFGTAKYDFIDNNPTKGANYYRIHEVDLDGSGSYSEVKLVNMQNAAVNYVQVWPNPAKDVIKIQNNNDFSVARIYNQSGSLISEARLKSGTNTINVSSLSFGAYIVNVKDANGKSYNQKFIKQ